MHSDWTYKYWDIIRNLYWTPKYLGFASISQDQWIQEGNRISVPLASVNPDGPLYARSLKFDALKDRLEGQEEILNHVFNLTFAIAGDEVISRLLCKSLEISDSGPFLSLGSDIRARYKWSRSENVTQQDGLFVTQRSIVGVELKLGSTSWPEQVAKYIALMVWEEDNFGKRDNLGLMFVVPEKALNSHWSTIGLTGPNIDGSFLAKLDQSRLPKKVRQLFEDRHTAALNIVERLRLVAISWTSFRDQIKIVESSLDPTHPGDQTLLRLLSGFRAQIEIHRGTGVN